MPNDNVQSPAHYTWHPSGIECIETIQDPMFFFYSAWTYLWRAPYKGMELMDLKKALFYTRALVKAYDTDDNRPSREQFKRWGLKLRETLERHGTTTEDFLQAFTPEYRAYFTELINTAVDLINSCGISSAHRLESLLADTIHNREGIPLVEEPKTTCWYCPGCNWTADPKVDKNQEKCPFCGWTLCVVNGPVSNPAPETEPILETRTTRVTVLPKNSTLYGFQATNINIQEEGGGEFVSLSQPSTEEVRFDPEEWPIVREAIDKAVAQCRSGKRNG